MPIGPKGDPGQQLISKTVKVSNPKILSIKRNAYVSKWGGYPQQTQRTSGFHPSHRSLGFKV